MATVPVMVNTVQHPLPSPARCLKFGAALGRAIAQSAELLNWLVARAALGGRVSKVHGNYHVPISNTASGMMLLENA